MKDEMLLPKLKGYKKQLELLTRYIETMVSQVDEEIGFLEIEPVHRDLLKEFEDMVEGEEPN